jgi:hypothetical protein
LLSRAVDFSNTILKEIQSTVQFNMLETLKTADQSRTAIGHFNVSDSVVLQAVTSAAREAGRPVIIGLSESERKFFGIREVAAMVNALRESPRTTDFHQCRSHALIGERSRCSESRF